MTQTHSGSGNDVTINELKRVFSFTEKVIVGVCIFLLTSIVGGLVVNFLTVRSLVQTVNAQETRIAAIEIQNKQWLTEGTPLVKPALQEIKETLRRHEDTFATISSQINDARVAQVRFEGKIDTVTQMLQQHEKETQDTRRNGLKPQAGS
jgi:hypothetical protein